MLKRVFLVSAVLIGSAFLPALSVAQNSASPPLDFSLSSMVLFALHENPDIHIAEEQQNQAEFTIDEARSAMYPSLTVGFSQNYQYNNPAAGKPAKKSNVNPGSTLNFSLKQLIFDGFSSESTVERRRKERDAASIQVDIAVKDVVSQTVENYIAIYRDQRTLADIEVFLDQINGIVNKVALMEQEGASSQVKLEYAKSRLSSAKTQLTDTVSSLNDSISNLEFLTGKLPPFNAEAPDELILDDNDLQQFIDYAFENNTGILLNEANLDAIEEDVQAKKGAFYPSVNFTLNGSRKNQDGGDIGPTNELTAAVNVNYQIFNVMGRRASVNKAKSRANELVITEKKLQKELKRDIRLLYNQLTSIKQSLIDTEDEIASNERLQALNRENFEYGDIDIIELIEGEERLVNSKRQKYGLEADLFKNAYDLLLTIGYLDKGYFCENC